MASITVSEAKRPAPSEEEEQQQQQQQQQRETSDEKAIDTNAPQPKRRRVADNARVRSAKACQRCRRLKEKCDGRQPCQRCTRSGRDCEFAPAGACVSGGVARPSGSASSSTRARPPPTSGASVVSAGEASVVAAESARSEERTKCLERLVQHLLGDVPMDLNNLRRMAEKASHRTGTGSDASSARAGTEDLDDLTLEDENFTVKTLSQSTAHYSGEFSHWNFSQKLRRRLSQCLDSDMATPSTKRDLRNNSALTTSSMPPPPSRNIPPVPPNNRPGMRILEYWRATQLQSPKTLVQSVLGCLPPRAVATFLVRIYFQFAQVNCFYAEETWLRRKLDFLYEAPGHVTSEDSAWVCSVLMVLAIGTQFAHMAAGPPEEEDNAEDSGHQSASTAAAAGLPGDADSDVGVTFYQMASKLIPDIITIASMESVQACLLLAHYALPLDTQGLAYTYLGLGIKMAIQNGMHRRYTGTDLDAWTVETRNRLWWTAYTVERRVSVLHGRPPSIAPTEVDAELPKDLPEFGPHDDASTFGNMAALIDMTLRLGDVANAITLLRRCPKNLQPTYFERIVDICQSLCRWWSTLPADVQDPAPSSPLFRSSAHLKLSLHLTDIFVGRPFIFSHASSSATSGVSPASAPSPPGGGSGAEHHGPRPRTRATLVSRAVEAAIAIVSLLRTLHETTGLARSSYTEFSSCRAALLVMLAQSVNDGPAAHTRQQRRQTPELRGAVELGMRLIRRMAAGNVSTQSETSVIEALEIAVRRLVEMQQMQQQQQAAGQQKGPAGEGDGRAGGDAAGGGGEEGDATGGVEGGHEEGDASKSGYERFREWASLWPAATSTGADALEEVARGSHHGHGRSTTTPAALAFADLKIPAAGFAPVGGGGDAAAERMPGLSLGMAGVTEHSPESARWMTMMDTAGMGVGIEQLDDLGLFGGFPELGALDGWPGLG